MTKAQAQRRHFHWRSTERLGVSFSNDEVQEIVRFIQSGGAQFIERASTRVTLWGVCLKGTDCVVVYDSKRKTIPTVLKREWVEGATP